MCAVDDKKKGTITPDSMRVRSIAMLLVPILISAAVITGLAGSPFTLEAYAGQIDSAFGIELNSRDINFTFASKESTLTGMFTGDCHVYKGVVPPMPDKMFNRYRVFIGCDGRIKTISAYTEVHNLELKKSICRNLVQTLDGKYGMHEYDMGYYWRHKNENRHIFLIGCSNDYPHDDDLPAAGLYSIALEYTCDK